MDQEKPRQTFDPTADIYNNCIRHLEDVVRLLIAQANTAALPWVPASPLTIVFQYSTEPGLVPVLSKATASLLAANQLRMRRTGGTPLFSLSSLCTSSLPHSHFATTKGGALHPLATQLPMHSHSMPTVQFPNPRASHMPKPSTHLKRLQLPTWHQPCHPPWYCP